MARRQDMKATNVGGATVGLSIIPKPSKNNSVGTTNHKLSEGSKLN